MGNESRRMPSHLLRSEEKNRKQEQEYEAVCRRNGLDTDEQRQLGSMLGRLPDESDGKGAGF